VCHTYVTHNTHCKRWYERLRRHAVHVTHLHVGRRYMILVRHHTTWNEPCNLDAVQYGNVHLQVHLTQPLPVLNHDWGNMTVSVSDLQCQCPTAWVQHKRAAHRSKHRGSATSIPPPMRGTVVCSLTRGMQRYPSLVCIRLSHVRWCRTAPVQRIPRARRIFNHNLCFFYQGLIWS
jgi:hypothetical protein